MVDEPGGVSYYGSIAATPYAKLVIEDIIKYKEYKPTTDIEEDIEKLNTKVNMPDLIGKNIYDAINILEDLNLQVEIEGEENIVTYQYPKDGVEVSVNSVVMIGS